MGTFLWRFLLLVIFISYLVTDSAAVRTAPGLHPSLLEIEVVATVKIMKLSRRDTYSTGGVDFDESCEDFFVENPTFLHAEKQSLQRLQSLQRQDCPKAHKVQSKWADTKHLINFAVSSDLHQLK